MKRPIFLGLGGTISKTLECGYLTGRAIDARRLQTPFSAVDLWIFIKKEPHQGFSGSPSQPDAAFFVPRVTERFLGDFF